MPTAASAPGKLVLMGEYAVVYGATAVAGAVDRRARVRIDNTDQPDCCIGSPGYADPSRFGIDDEAQIRFHTDSGARDFALVGHVIQCLLDTKLVPVAALSGLEITVDTAEFFHPDARSAGGKLGFGSSAALTVALAYGLLAHNDGPLHSPQALLPVLTQAHRRFQNGRGSGIDIAAALGGGLIAYAAAPSPTFVSHRLPPCLYYAGVWSGRSASTGRFLAGVQDWRERQPLEAERVFATLRQLAARGVHAVAAGDGRRLLEAIAAYGRSMADLGTLSGLDIVSAAHRHIGAIAERAGIVYKPSGAGGGDVGIALARDPQRLAQWRYKVEQAGFYCLDLCIGASGVKTEDAQVF